MFAKFGNVLGVPMLSIAPEPLKGFDACIDHWPRGFDGHSEPATRASIHFGDMSNEQVSKWAAAFHYAAKIAAGETYMMIGDHAPAFIAEEQKMWTRVREMEIAAGERKRDGVTTA